MTTETENTVQEPVINNALEGAAIEAAETSNTEPSVVDNGTEAVVTEPEKPAIPKGYVPQHVVQKRIDQLTRKKYELEQQLETFRRSAENPEGEPRQTFTQEDVRKEAQRILQEENFNRRCDDIYKTGCEKFSDFSDTLANFSALGGLSNDKLELIAELPNAEEVLYTLANDLNKADEVFSLPAHKQALELAKLSVSMANKPEAPKHKPASRAPAPVEPIGGAANSSIPNEKMAMDEWVRAREAQLKSKVNG